MLIVRIHNDGTGTDASANYTYEVLVNNEVVESGRVIGHDRSDGWPALLLDIAAGKVDKNIVSEY